MRVRASILVGLIFAAVAGCSGSQDDELGGGDAGSGGVTDGGGHTEDGGRDAGSGMVDSGIEDAGAGDSGNGLADSGQDASLTPGVTLSASSLPATPEQAILIASITGFTAQSVAFYEGTTLLGTDEAAPFEHALTFAFEDNGDHTYTAVATGPSGDLSSAPITIQVAVPANGVFVDYVNGSDDYDGSQSMPFKTLAKAAMATSEGQTVYLYDGVHEFAANAQPRLFALKAGVKLHGLSATGVVIHAQSDYTLMVFANGGGIENVQFDTVNQVGSSNGDLPFVLRNVQFTNFNVAFIHNGSAQVTLDGTARPMFVNSRTGAQPALWTDGTTNVRFEGDVTNLENGGSHLFLVRGKSTLTLENANFENLNRALVTVRDNAHLVLRDVVVDGLAWPGQSALVQSALEIGGHNTESPLAWSITLENTIIRNCALTGIHGVVYGNLATVGTIALTNSQLINNDGDGVRVTNAGTATIPGLNVQVNLVDSDIRNSGRHGISVESGKVSLDNAQISGNGRTTAGNAVVFPDANFHHELFVRDSTFNNNMTGHNLSFSGTATSVFDLGQNVQDPGTNTFSGVGASFAAVNLSAAITGRAIGNTWLPNVQGSNATTGQYSGSVSFSNTSGQNVSAGATSTLVVSE